MTLALAKSFIDTKNIEMYYSLPIYVSHHLKILLTVI